MGTSKALLDWHGAPLAWRVAGVLARVASPVVIVAAPGQRLPDIPGVEVVADRAEGRGPLEAIASGLGALAGRSHTAFVSAVDAPFLHPDFVLAVTAALGSDEIAVPDAYGRRHPLAAAYRTAALPAIEELMAAGMRAPAQLTGHLRARSIPERELVRPESLENVNTPGEYRAALRRPQPLVRVDGELVRASRLGALGLELARVALNGELRTAGQDVPLVDGDVIETRGRA